MRVLFAGSPEIALPALRRISATQIVVGVLTNPDSVSGRGLAATATPVARCATELGLPVLSFERLGPESRLAVAALEPELLVSFAYGRIFGPKFLALFPRGGLNVHPSLLPRHRGASPILQAILSRDAETGVSVQALAPELDSGDLYGVVHLPLDGRETTESLSATAAQAGAELLDRVLAEIEAGRASPQAQHGEPSFCGHLAKDDGLLDWSLPALDIDARIRAFWPWPVAYSFLRGTRLNLLEARPYPRETWPGEGRPAPGTVLGLDKARGLMVQTGDGLIALGRLQLQTKKALPYREFANGVRDLAGAVLGTAAHEEPGKSQ